MKSVRPIKPRVFAGFPTRADHAVILQGVAEQGPDAVPHAVRPGYKISMLTHEQRHETSALCLQKVMALLANKPGLSRVKRLLPQLLKATKGINDGEVLIEVGKLLFFHGAHCMDAVPRGRKPFYKVQLSQISRGKGQP